MRYLPYTLVSNCALFPLDPAARLAFGPPDEVAAGAGAQVAHAVAQIGRREEDRVPRAAGGVEHLRKAAGAVVSRGCDGGSLAGWGLEGCGLRG